MNQHYPLVVSRSDCLKLHIGNYVNKASNTLIFEPVEAELFQILMCEDKGPIIAIGSRRWPVRAYDLSYSIDRLMCQERFRNNPKAIVLYPFERYLANGVLARSSTDVAALLKKRVGTPEELSTADFRRLQGNALILPTETPGEMRLMKPMRLALDEISGATSVRGR